MKKANVHDLLFRAASDAEVAYLHNLDKPNHMRISRVGQPLVCLLLEDFVFSKLPTLPTKLLSQRQQNANKVKRTMAQATGYLFEQVLIDIFCENENLKVLPQYRVDLGFLGGTADIVLVNEAEARVTVVECKALKYATKKEACTYALFNDASTGYLSQLVVYKNALEQEYKNYEVEACWMVWCKASASLFKVPLSESKVNENDLMLEAKSKCASYANFAYLWAEGLTDTCLQLLDLTHLPLKEPMYGNWQASCSAHYSPWAKLLLDETGVPWDDYKENLNLMLKVSLENDGKAKETLLQLVQEH